MKSRATSCFVTCLLTFVCGEVGSGREPEQEPVYMGRTVRQWIADLKDADAEVRHQAAYALSRMTLNLGHAFPALKDAVKDSDPSVRHYAAESLGYTGPEALPVLLELLESEETRYSAVMGLQHMETDPLPALLKRLEKGEVRQRRAAVAALRSLSQCSGNVRTALQLALKDADGLVRIEAIEALRATNPNHTLPLEFALELLKDKNAEVRLRAMFMLLEPETDAEGALPALEKLLNDPDKRVRVSAAGMVGRQDARRSMAMLAVAREALKDSDVAVRERALSAVYHIVLPSNDPGRGIEFREDAARAALPDLLAFLRDYKRQPKKMVQQILWNLLRMEPDDKDVVPVLMAMARDAEPELSQEAARVLAFQFPHDPAVKSVLPDNIRKAPDRVRREAMAALLTLKKRPENLVRGLVDLLEEPGRPGLRSQAAAILGELGAEAKEALPALRRALEEKTPMIRQSALLAVLRIEPDRAAELTPMLIRACNWEYSPPHDIIQACQARAGEVVPVLVQGLKDTDALYRFRAASLLCQMAQSTRSAIPDLRIALENRDPSVRILAAMSLARISPQTEGIAPVLREGLTFNDYAIREQVFNAIQEIGPAARVCAPELIRVLKNKNEGRFRSKAAFALLSVDPSAPELGPAFAALVKHPDPQVRMDAFNLLGRVNLTDKALLTTLLDMVRDDPTGPQQYQVFDAIARFGAAASEELSKRLNDKDPLVRAAFLNLYVRTGGANADEFYATLDRALKDDAPGVRLAAASTLLGRDRESKKALESVLPVVKQCLESADFSVRQRAIGTLHQAAMRHSGRELPQEVTSLLLEQAKAKVARVRQSALGALMNIHPTPKEAEPLLIEALRDKDPGVRNAAVHSLRLQPGRMKEIVPALIELLKSRDDMIMNQVIYSLAQAGREEKTAIAALIEHYRKLRPASYVRVTVLSALAQCGGNAKDAIPLCVEALKDDNDQLRQAAVQTLMRLDPANKLLVTALVDMYGRERGPYARIGRPHRHERNQKPLGPQAVKELCEILANDKDADRRAGAAIVLGTMVQDPKGAADALKNAMKDADPCVRLQAADSYWLIANDARTPIPVLLAGLKEKDMGLRQYAAQVVAEMGKEATHVVPQLVAALKGQDDQTAAMLIHALSQMGNDAAPAIPALVEIVRDGGSSYGIRARAAQALMPFGREAKDAVPALLDMLKGGPQNRHDRGAAAMALARIATPTEALPALLEAFVEPQTREHDRNEDAITKAIIQFGADAVGPVAELLQDKRPEVRVRAISVLVRFGQQARDIVPQLMAVMEDKDVDVALNAAEAVWKIDRRPEVLPHFMRGLKAKTPYNRVRAARNLMTMGAQAKPAVPDLIAACKDRDSSVRREAYQALMALEPETARNLGDPEADKK